jgi:16S rRNA (cytosine967-C5)-methyltransferase
LTNSREIASLILSNVYQGKKLDWALNTSKSLAKLDSRDRSFVSLLVLTALRRHGQIDKIISKFIKKPLKSGSQVIYILKIALAQIIFMDTPDYSAVNIAVETSKKYNLDKLVNGVLRSVLREKNTINVNSTEENIPNWLRKTTIDHLGEDTLFSISKQIVKEPPIDIKVKKQIFQKFNWEEVLGGKNIFRETIRINHKGDISKLPFYSEGHWWIQGLAATLPVILINEIYKNQKKNEVSILDVGAAPGGKSFQLIESGFKLKSIEISNVRIKKLLKNLNRLKYETEIINGDFITHKIDDKFNCILIDAPCSGSGLIQKKPEMLVIKKDINNLKNKQKLMLERASKLLKDGGYLIYCVCSIIYSEGEEQIHNFLQNFKNFSLVNCFSSIESFGIINNNPPYFFITPDFITENGGIDGFFIACFKKNY